MPPSISSPEETTQKAPGILYLAHLHGLSFPPQKAFYYVYVESDRPRIRALVWLASNLWLTVVSGQRHGQEAQAGSWRSATLVIVWGSMDPTDESKCLATQETGQELSTISEFTWASRVLWRRERSAPAWGLLLSLKRKFQTLSWSEGSVLQQTRGNRKDRGQWPCKVAYHHSLTHVTEAQRWGCLTYFTLPSPAALEDW